MLCRFLLRLGELTFSVVRYGDGKGSIARIILERWVRLEILALQRIHVLVADALGFV